MLCLIRKTHGPLISYSKKIYEKNKTCSNKAFSNEKAFLFSLVETQTFMLRTVDLHFEGLKRDLFGKQYFIYLITT